MHKIPEFQHKKKHILIIDDDKKILKLLSKFLMENDFVVNSAENAEQAENFMKRFKFDLLVLDVMMPGKTGVEFSRKLKQEADSTPIIMLTAMSDVENRILGLESGAEDYLGKPFEPKELLLRINNLIKRSELKSGIVVQFGSFAFNLENQLLKCRNEEITLTTSEANLLTIFCKNFGKIVTRAEICQKISVTNERSIDVLIGRLRGKIEQNAKHPTHLKSVRGSGYVLN